MPKVYITNYCGLDYKKAERFGNLISVTSGFVDLSDLSKVKENVKENLKDFTSSDYLLFSGPTILCILSIVECINLTDRYEKNYSQKINALVWINRQQDYIEIKL